MKTIALLVFGLAGGTCLAACAIGAGNLRAGYLDRGTGVTLSAAPEAMVFARTEARYSRSTRDYIYIGPVETNRQGLLEHFLWVGIASTLDRGFLAPEQSPPSRLEMIVAGEPMEFALTGWPPAYLSTSLPPAYEPPAALHYAYSAPVTLDQLRLLSGNQPESIRLLDAAGTGRVFVAWSAAEWNEFLNARR